MLLSEIWEDKRGYLVSVWTLYKNTAKLKGDRRFLFDHQFWIKLYNLEWIKMATYMMHSMLPSWAVTSCLLPLSSRFHSTSEDCSRTWPVGSASFMWRQIVSAPLAFSIKAQFISVGNKWTEAQKGTFAILLCFVMCRFSVNLYRMQGLQEDWTN